MAAMAVMGVWIGVSVDTYGRFFYRGKQGRWNALQIAGDLLFWLMQGLLVFYVLLNINDGDVRIYIFLALLCGYAAYRSLFQTLYRSLLEGIIRTVRFLFRMLKKTIALFFIRPVQLLAKFVYTVIKLIVTAILAVLLFAWKVVWIPLKWLLRLVLPDALFVWVKKFFAKVAGIYESMKKIKDKLISWFKK
jgi:spore cortex biosynthesis protein YabQ